MHNGFRLVELFIGVVLVVLGVVTLLVPFIPGTLLIIAGLAVLGVIHIRHRKRFH